jgi:threonine aldolase
MSEKLKKIFKEKGFKFLIDSPTNQIFLIMDNNQIKKLQKKVAFRFWSKYDDKHTVMRFVTSWSTSESDVEKLKVIL